MAITDICFVGHYLSGVMALFGAMDFKRIYKKIESFLRKRSFTIEVYTYGAPRIGNLLFAEYVDSLLEKKILDESNSELRSESQTIIDQNFIDNKQFGNSRVFRVTYSDDYITQLPKLPNFFHHTNEYWINPSCNCDIPDEVYVCFGNYFSKLMHEPKLCNQDAVRNSLKPLVQRLGPYFGYMMGYCENEKLLI
ncbi:hypothetical protein G9A89_008462 [Geosiphon pyriformis]|nr:hypothetical protein G9A89_008462 [Geosiphon pyriformis]